VFLELLAQGRWRHVEREKQLAPPYSPDGMKLELVHEPRFDQAGV
jgi:hypothetical protein